METPLPTNEEGYNPRRDYTIFSWNSDLRIAIGIYVELGRRIQQHVPSYAEPFFTESLRLVESQIELVDKYPEVLYHEDFSNFHIHDGQLAGLFDFEVCRLGTELMQVNTLLGSGRGLNLDREALIEGYLSLIGHSECLEDTLGLLAMDHLGKHIRICQAGRWDGSEASRRHSERYVDSYLDSMKKNVLRHGDLIDIEQWFPSLT